VKRAFITLLTTAIIAVRAFADADDKPAKSDAPPQSSTSRDTNGNIVVMLSAEIQKRIELKTEPLVATNLAPELKAYGRIEDPGALASLINDVAASRAAWAASSNELARLKTLSTSGNASARSLEGAEATALHDQLQTQAAEDKLRLAWGREIVDRTNLPAFMRSLVSADTALVRVDLPAGQHLQTAPSAARVVGLAGHSSAADFLGAAMSVDPQTQGQGWLFQIATNSVRFLPGEAVTAYLKIPGEPIPGIIVPRDAVIRADGKGWVYVAGGESNFTRTDISFEQPTDAGWFVTNNVSAGDKVVTAGAQAILSEEQKGAFQAPD
jgi:hypothetical protein